MVNESVWIIHPVNSRGEMKSRSVFFFIESIDLTYCQQLEQQKYKDE